MLLRQFVVDFDANPRIGGSVHLLLGSEVLGLPIAQSLSLRYLLAEDNARYLAETLILDAIFAHLALEIDKALRLEFAKLAKS